MLTQLLRHSLVLTTASLISGCAGLAIPITRSVPSVDDSKSNVEAYRRLYDHPRDLALSRVAQWNAAIVNLERANGGSIIGQSGVAGAVMYRSARNLSYPATALLAATGLYANTLSDAFVQVSRINVYLAGVEGMECAIAAYGTLPSPYSTKQSLKDIALLSTEGTDLAQEIMLSQNRSELALNGAMVLAVSRISRKVDAALMGSLVTAQSQGSSWTNAYSSVEQSKLTPDQRLKMAANLEDSPARGEARARLQNLLASALALESAVSERKAQINACDITAPNSRIDRTAQPLSVDHLGEANPVNIKVGAQASVRVLGGLPPYASKVIEPNTAKITVKVSDGGYASIVVPPDATVGQYRIAFTDTTLGAPAKILNVVVVP